MDEAADDIQQKFLHGNDEKCSHRCRLAAVRSGARVPESGLNYNYYRFYDASIGRYAESDPLGLRGGLATFNYALNRPLRLVDATGLQSVGGPVDPGSANTIQCDGKGNIEPYIVPNQDPCVVDCITEHELTHAQDMNRLAPGLCAGKASGSQVYFTTTTIDATECNAYRKERTCLLAALGGSGGGSGEGGKPCQDGNCSSARRKLLSFSETKIVEHYILPTGPLPR